jgi:branched-subunit amino acid ABC-type transport system permease component
MTLGMAQILTGIFNNTFGLLSDSFAVRTNFGSPIAIGPFATSQIRFIALFLSASMVAVLIVFFRQNKIGRALRAVFQDREVTELHGVNVHGLYRFAYVLGGSVVAYAGMIYILAYPVDLTLGWNIAVLAFAIMIVGGPGSVMGCMAIGLTFGFTRAIVTLVSNPTTANFAFYAIMLLTLLVKPMGLFRR